MRRVRASTDLPATPEAGSVAQHMTGDGPGSDEGSAALEFILVGLVLLVPVIILCALIVFFPILVAAVVGLRMVPRDVVDAARSDGAGSVALLRYIEAPMALPGKPGEEPVF